MDTPTEANTVCRRCGAPFTVNPNADMVNCERPNRELGIKPDEWGWIVQGLCTAQGCGSTEGLYPRG